MTDIQRTSADGDLWISASDGIWRSRAGVLQNVAPRSGPGMPRLRVGPDGRAWYAVRDSVYRDGRAVFGVAAPGAAGPSGDRQVNDMVWDDEGNLWIATVRHGLFRLRPSAIRVVGVPEGMASPNVTVFQEDGTGAVWAGTRAGGLARIDGFQATPYGPERGVPPSVTALLLQPSGELWVGGLRSLVVCPAATMSCGAPTPAAPPDIGSIHALHRDAQGRIWVGTDRGLLRFADEGWTWLDTGIPTGNAVRSFLARPDGTLLMGTNGAGVLIWREDRFWSIGEAEGLPTRFIRSLLVDDHGHLWVGTEGHGLARITLDLGGEGVAVEAVEVVRQRDGLPDNVVHRILQEDDGHLWLSTNRGLGRVRLEALEAFADGTAPLVPATVFTERDGLRNREANGGLFPSAIRTRDGRLWFATQDGVAIVDPADLGSSDAPPPVAIERLVTPARTLASGPSIELRPDERDFEIDYTALRLADPENLRFRFRLEGLSETWTEAGERRTAYFTRVPPGTYTFRVTASGAEGVWHEAGAVLPLRVVPRFHETAAARLLFGLLATTLVIVGWQWRTRALRERERELSVLVEARTADLRTSERRLEAQNARLAELDEAKSRLFTNLSHEFPTPLTLILGPLRGLLDGRHGELPEEARAQGDLMLRNGRRLLRLVNQVLDLSRLEAGHVVLDARPADLVAFARGVTLAFSPLAERQQIELRFHTDVPSLTLSFDREQLEKVLLNLLSNALKFTPEGGAVDVSVRAEGGAVRIEVRDTGIGIVEEELPHVFDRFHQASRSDTRRHEGSGIGLALARELTELHGGTIRAESRPGEGSTFSVTLPGVGEGAWVGEAEPAAGGAGDVPPSGERGKSAVADRRAETNSEADPPLDGPLAGTDTEDGPPDKGESDEDRTTVLLVDDNPDIRAYVRSVLAPGYRIVEAADGRQGLERARADLPDLIVADVMMPELDGLAMGRALKSDPMTDAIPVLLLTAKAEAEDRVRGLEVGADAYLVKPFDPNVLEAQVRNLLEQRRRLRERFRTGEVQAPVPVETAPSPPSELDLRLRPLLEARIHEPGFGPNELAAAAGLSYHRLYRGLKAELDTSPSRYIHTVRVECARALLASRAASVTEIGYSVGFESLSYFSRSYRERFGVPPSEHLGDDATV